MKANLVGVLSLLGVILMPPLSALDRAWADEIPEKYLQRDFESCAAKAKPGQEEYWEDYCDCVVDEMRHTMDLKEYLILSVKFKNYQKKTKTQRVSSVLEEEKLGNIIMMCLKEVTSAN